MSEAAQRSPEWRSERLGTLTSTRAASLMGTKGGRETLMAEMIAEIATAKEKGRYESVAMAKGSQIEPEAIRYYEFMYGDTVTEPDTYVVSDIHPRIACSPDGLIGTDGGIEIKSLNRHNHIKVIVSDKIEKQYEHQIQWQMLVTGRQWWDYFGYCPDLPEPLRGFRKRFYRDDKTLDKYKQAALSFLDELEGLLARYQLTL